MLLRGESGDCVDAVDERRPFTLAEAPRRAGPPAARSRAGVNPWMITKWPAPAAASRLQVRAATRSAASMRSGESSRSNTNPATSSRSRESSSRASSPPSGR